MRMEPEGFVDLMSVLGHTDWDTLIIIVGPVRVFTSPNLLLDILVGLMYSNSHLWNWWSLPVMSGI